MSGDSTFTRIREYRTQVERGSHSLKLAAHSKRIKADRVSNLEVSISIRAFIAFENAFPFYLLTY